MREVLKYSCTHHSLHNLPDSNVPLTTDRRALLQSGYGSPDYKL